MWIYITRPTDDFINNEMEINAKHPFENINGKCEHTVNKSSRKSTQTWSIWSVQ